MQATLADDVAFRGVHGRRFSEGTRPVIRWVKGDGRDDMVTRAAIGQATRLFGTSVDYCLCTNGLDAARVQWTLEWATQPVEWWPVTPEDNHTLATALIDADCAPQHFGYWWKWFPERVRPDAPEWVLDGDMVVIGRPAWFDAWLEGRDRLRLSQDDRWPRGEMYGRYGALVDPVLRFYSGLASLPPGLRYMDAVAEVLAEQPLDTPHDGVISMSEQGVIAVAFQRLGATPIPLHEFPFGRAFQNRLDHGLQGDLGRGWGYHFGAAFRAENHHFTTLQNSGAVLKLTQRPDVVARHAWLGAQSQWGLPGWSTADPMARLITDYARGYAGCQVLELGTSRGRLAAMLAALGCRVTTIDRHDRGAATNLATQQIRVVRAEAHAWLADSKEVFDLILVDLHGNGPQEWAERGALLLPRLAEGGMLLVCNATLARITEWSEETGVPAFLAALGRDWTHFVHDQPAPGLAVVTRRARVARAARHTDADLHLWVDGEPVWPATRANGRHVFRLVGPIRRLELRSRSQVPKDAGLSDDDPRRLGVAVRCILVDGPGFGVKLMPDWPGFEHGFHDSEGPLRWTDGCGRLDLTLLTTAHGGVTVTVDAYEQRHYLMSLPVVEQR